MYQEAALLLAGIAILSLACQWLAWWVKLPAILFLLAVGIILGPVAGVLDPDLLFGDLLFPFVSLAVAIILFEGSLTLKFTEIRDVSKVVQRLITVGALLTWAVLAVTSHFILDFAWPLALLFGALTVVTGPTVIVPLLRTVRPSAPVANVLRWEGILIDPIGAVLAVLVYELLISSGQGGAWGHTLLIFGEIVLVGLVLGAGAAWFLGLLIRRRLLPHYLHNLATLSLVALAFSVSNYLAHESGLLTVTVMGMWLANMRQVNIDEILNFKENLSIVLISALFIILAARIEFHQLSQLGLGALVILLVAQFVARPLAVLVSSYKSPLKWQERALLSWIAPRGIVAAAVSALFALRLEASAYPQANLLVPMTFLMIVGTVILQSATAGRLARLLSVQEPEPRGFLIVGANAVARMLGTTLKDLGFRVLHTDSSWDNIRHARMDGLQTYFGNPISAHADQHLDLVGIGRLLALSPQRELNVMASMRYAAEFGRDCTFSLRTSQELKTSDKHQVASAHRGHTLFGADVTYAKLASLLSQKYEVHLTTLSENFQYADYLAKHSGRGIFLFARTPRGSLRIFAENMHLTPGPGWTLASLLPPHSPEEVPRREPESPAKKSEKLQKTDKAAKGESDKGENIKDQSDSGASPAAT